MVDLKKDIGKRIATLRKQRGITKKEMVEVLDVTVGYLTLIERGDRGTSLEHLVMIAEILGITMDFLILGHEKDFDKGDSLVRFMDQFEPDEKKLLIKIGMFIKRDNTETELETVQQLISLYAEYKNKKSGNISHP